MRLNERFLYVYQINFCVAISDGQIQLYLWMIGSEKEHTPLLKVECLVSSSLIQRGGTV